MSDPHILLLIPPDGDTTLLADEAGGGRVPMMYSYWRYEAPGRGWLLSWADYPGPDVPGLLAQRALLLVHNGAPVAMAVDRAARTLTARTVAHVATTGTGTIRAFSVCNRYRVARREGVFNPWGVLDLCDAWASEGAKIVALSADGREVTP